MSTQRVSPWFQYWQRKPRARIRLFCFPYAGGGASIYRLWSDDLPPEVEVWPVQLPGRENRLTEKPFSQLQPLLETLAAVLHPYLDMPYAFFGHSMGAMLSFELARALRRQGAAPGPIHLFVSGRRAPQVPKTEPLTFHLPEAAFIEELRRLQGTPEEVLQNAELLPLLLPLLRADFELCETYSYMKETPLQCPITAFGGLQDHEVSREDIMPWSVQTYGPFKVRFFLGGHFFLHKERLSLLQNIALNLFAHKDMYEKPHTRCDI